MNVELTQKQARRLWIRAQRLNTDGPFGAGPEATRLAVEHLGYVQIDTINVIERCHHHILFNRIPEYRRDDLFRAQAREKSVFEYWTHALSYVPTRDYRYFMSDMDRRRKTPGQWFQGVKPEELRKVFRLIKSGGAISIRDIKDDVLVEKDHEWASRKPSKRALQLAFYDGRLTVSERLGMLKKYELSERHFSWTDKPRRATQTEILNYLLDRALRSQALVSLDSICHLDAKRKPLIRKLIDSRVRRGELVAVSLKGVDAPEHWLDPRELEGPAPAAAARPHLLSPFDPLTIQRKRLKLFFGYEHRFEAYLPPPKRVYGYFALPVLAGDRIVAAIDLKTDREAGKLLLKKWTWLEGKSPALKREIEGALDLFEKFQLAGGDLKNS